MTGGDIINRGNIDYTPPVDPHGNPYPAGGSVWASGVGLLKEPEVLNGHSDYPSRTLDPETVVLQKIELVMPADEAAA